MTTFEFESVTLLIPALWDKPWDELIDEAEGLEREFLRAQARYARMLQRVASSPTTPEKVGWLALWSRLFGCLTGGRGAAIWESRFAESVIMRVANEATLHVQAIMLPVLEAVERDDHRIHPDHWNEVRDRLRGYVVWSLRGDERLYRHVSDERRLAEAFDPRPERELIKELGDLQEAWTHFSGQTLELTSDSEAFHDRARAEGMYRSELNRILKWLSDVRLQQWRRRLLDLEKQLGRTVSLFDLFNLGSSVPAFLRSQNTGVGYFEYLMGSAFVHGSSLSASMLTLDGLIAPDFANLGSGFVTAADRILSHCRLHGLLLELFAAHLESQPPTV